MTIIIIVIIIIITGACQQQQQPSQLTVFCIIGIDPNFPGPENFSRSRVKKFPKLEFSGNQCVLRTQYSSVVSCRLT